ncbi:beta-N-acetylhexosaminidase [Aquamicrobium segne]|uniref:beta-N-acetylhexosaminidase n=1 Tax=Aquamicrobium segne TaxID=469547 RepID=A0ABW0H1K6_9HYPH
MSESKAFILGCSGQTLLREEIRFYRGECPWGFILFARNISEPEQIRDLVAGLRDCVGREDAPIFIDQEGGRVQRLRPPLAPNYPPAAAIGEIYQRDHEAGLRAAWLHGRLHGFDLARYGVTADCLPVLDVPVENASDVIGERAYGRDPEVVARLGRAAAEGLMAGGVLPVMKHIPGHGRALVDTHFELPTVHEPLEQLRQHDFIPFRALNDLPAAMTAHVVFDAIDPKGPATTSAKVVADIIRGEIGFDGLLMSDDISMKALAGDFSDRAAVILNAGVDIVLHCNGVMEEMRAIASKVKALEGEAAKRAERALSVIGAGHKDSEDELRAEFAQYFAIMA